MQFKKFNSIQVLFSYFTATKDTLLKKPHCRSAVQFQRAHTRFTCHPRGMTRARFSTDHKTHNRNYSPSRGWY